VLVAALSCEACKARVFCNGSRWATPLWPFPGNCSAEGDHWCAILNRSNRATDSWLADGLVGSMRRTPRTKKTRTANHHIWVLLPPQLGQNVVSPHAFQRQGWLSLTKKTRPAIFPAVGESQPDAECDQGFFVLVCRRAAAVRIVFRALRRKSLRRLYIEIIGFLLPEARRWFLAWRSLQ